MNIFSSIKILDLTKVFSSPFATRHFADFGAEVIKIEPPKGDDSRNFPPIIDNWSGYFEILNRNKKSLVLDLKQKEDLSRFYKLCKNCDVIIENFSPNIKNKLKINYPIIKKINPKIIYASLSGVSEKINRKYYDIIAQAESGLMSLNGKKDDMKNATSIIDAFSGMKLAYAISSALFNREITKKGCQIHISMKGVAFDLLEQNLIATSISNKNPEKVGNMDSAIAPFGIFKAKNANIVLAIGNDNQWNKFKNIIKNNNPTFNDILYKNNQLRLKNLTKLTNEIESFFKEYTVEEIILILKKADIPCAKVNTMLDVLKDNENFNENLLEKINHSIAGEIAVSTGGVFFSENKNNKYKESPQLDINKNEI